ncbi:MAG: 3-phosphoglycerate dehydrogenase [Planctomycetota bacterium]|nr:MAG: 3-phosphoglycerate dehydrogenase [Planctomycetota bacterium]REJ89517.1 MAG: 3-phosphoglycerate dehydrogenase [Planctomycetota bacterium]REK28912.1 MAG: 3-phosphoglycerate dehydrogenase [Planctomycetota bacterium]REK39654.1 MAG: 3-phosphoglycerate dehydrogenase [Planctomycetota bacterium]
MKPKVRICALGSDEGPHVAILESAGFEVLPGRREVAGWTQAEIIEALQGCSAVIAGAEPYPRSVLESLPNLRVIARTGVGFDSIDIPACDELGIVVCTTPGVNHESVAEHALALLLGVGRGFPALDQRVRQGDWKRVYLPRVAGSTLGIVGLGRIGKALASRAVGIGMTVIASEPFPDEDFCRQRNIELVEIDDLLRRSDFVSLHNPLTPETQHFMNADRFARMKQGSVLINTSRGGLVDEQALIAALRSGRLRGAGLDVFEVEPLPMDSPLLGMSNVLLCGHIAGNDLEARHDSQTMAAECIVALRNGEWPAHAVQNLPGATDWSW